LLWFVFVVEEFGCGFFPFWGEGVVGPVGPFGGYGEDDEVFLGELFCYFADLIAGDVGGGFYVDRGGFSDGNGR